MSRGVSLPGSSCWCPLFLSNPDRGYATACQEDKGRSIVSLILLMSVYYGASYVNVPTWGVVTAEELREQWLCLEQKKHKIDKRQMWNWNWKQKHLINLIFLSYSWHFLGELVAMNMRTKSLPHKCFVCLAVNSFTWQEAHASSLHVEALCALHCVHNNRGLSPCSA